MKKLGTVKNVIHDGSILLSTSGIPADSMPARGTRAFDRRGLPVGRVARVFGPVKEPYVTLKPNAETDTLGLLGASLYLDPEERVARKTTTTRGRPEKKWGKRSAGGHRKKGVKTYRRKENPRKK